MASFVEQATLKIDDQSTKQIRSINKELNKLFKSAAKLKKLSFDIGGIKKAQNQLRALNASFKKLPKSRTVNLNINQKGTVPKIPKQPAQPRVPAPPRGGGPAPQRGGWRTNQTLSFAKAIIYSYGAIKVGSAALEAVNAAQAQDTRERSIFRNDKAMQDLIDAAGKAAALNSPRIDYTRGREIATDIAVGGTPTKNVAAMTTLFANTESAVGALFPGLEKSVTLFNNKLLNLSNSSDDLARSSELVKGAAQGIAAAGESFNAPTTIAALRQSNLAPTIDAQGLARFILITDAMGQSAGSSLNRLRKELFIPDNMAGAGSGIAKGAIANLNEKGMRGYNADQQRAFGQDPVKFVQEVLGPRIAKQGVDLNDRAAIDRYLQSAGFNQTSQRFILQALTSLDEINQQLKVVGGIDPNNPNAGAEGNLLLATKDLIASFNTLSSTVLTPLAEKIAPYVTGIANYVEKIALTGSTLDKLQVAAAAAAGVFTTYKAGTSILNGLFNPLNASANNLNMSAAALTNAAKALGGSGVGGVPGSGGAGSPKAGLRTSFGWAGVAGAFGIALNELQRDARYSGLDAAGKTAAAQADFADARASSDAASGYIKDWLTSVLGKATSDLIVAPKPVQGPNLPPVAMGDGRESSLDAFLAGPTQFEQAFTSGSQTASTNIETGLTTGANAITGNLAGAFAAGAELLAQKITGAINSAVINAPRIPSIAADTGTMTPRE